MCSTPTPCASHRCRGDRSSVGLLGLSCAATTLNLRGVVSIVKSDVVPGNVDVAGRSGGRIGHAQIIPALVSWAARASSKQQTTAEVWRFGSTVEVFTIF
ncbi:uncharacterized protein LOC124666125 isoform X2 [Lolium rigidum]|uniref:uncharacterized protein LOC124666125 isoform X2 n=1 Tax=Lolium rigidum TaxID=89674 RepID=UPI001F5C36B9|nr:uncharacterized protein LOC124666125 isoform X2 [Lolium rigidum]